MGLARCVTTQVGRFHVRKETDPNFASLASAAPAFPQQTCSGFRWGMWVRAREGTGEEWRRILIPKLSLFGATPLCSGLGLLPHVSQGLVLN